MTMTMTQERQFGFFIAVVVLALGLWWLFAGELHAWYWVATGAALVAVTAALPRVWTPVLRVWLPIAHVLGWINTRIILGAVYLVMIVPMGWVLRRVGHDPLRLRTPPGASAWVKREKDWPPASFKDPF